MKREDRKRIVLINQVCGKLYTDIANAFADEYDEVVLITGEVQTLSQQLSPKVKRVSIKKYNRKSSVTRFYSWIIAFIQIFLLIKFKYRNDQLFISSNPPVASTLIPLCCSNKISLLIYDIYPNGLMSAGFLTNESKIIKWWSHLNKKSYKKVDHVITITKGMADLLTSYVDRKKITVVPVWGSVVYDEERKKESNAFIEEYKLHNKFIVMYSGNLGKGHSVETLVYLARKMKTETDIQFIIAGEGWKKEMLRNLIDEYKLDNCLLLPFLPAEMFLDSLYAIDLGVVSLGEKTSRIAIPSKTFNLIAARKPILGLGNRESDLADLLKDNGIGDVFTPQEEDQVQSLVLQLKNDESMRLKLSENSRKASYLYTSKNAKEIVNIV